MEHGFNIPLLIPSPIETLFAIFIFFVLPLALIGLVIYLAIRLALRGNRKDKLKALNAEVPPKN